MTSTTTSKVWFITGCSSGFGSSLCHEIMSRGDKVVATARNVDKLDDLKKLGADVMQFDVTASLDELKKRAQQAHGLHGTIDYLINNAGYVLQRTFEELSPEEAESQYQTNVFGLINVTRAFLPYMRAAKAGIIGNVSSIGAWMGFACGGINRKSHGTHIEDYEGTTARKMAALMDSVDNKQPGDIKKGARVMVDVLSDKHGKGVPIRLVLGTDGYSTIKQKCEETLRILEEWKDISCSTDHDDVEN